MTLGKVFGFSKHLPCKDHIEKKQQQKQMIPNKAALKKALNRMYSINSY